MKFRVVHALSFLAVAAALLSPLAARASQVRVTFQNAAPRYVWVTFYRREFTTVVPHWEIIGGDRTVTGPRQVDPKSTYTFTLPNKGSLRIRIEPMDACGNKITSTEYTIGNGLSGVTTLQFTLHKDASRESYWITRP